MTKIIIPPSPHYPNKRRPEVLDGPRTVDSVHGGKNEHSRVEVLDFADYNQALEYAHDSNPHWAHNSSASHNDCGGSEWSGAKSYEHAEQMARDGWPKGMESAEKLRLQLCSVAGSRSMRPKLWKDVAGFAPCVPAAIAGEPESMYSVRRQETPGTGKIVSIVYNICVSAGLDAQTLILRGAICLALVDTLEACGFRCQVTLAAGCRFTGVLSQLFIRLKESDQGLNVDTLAFWLASPASFRRIMFSIWENGWENRLPHGYGQPAGIIPEQMGDIYLSEAHLMAVNDETAPAFLTKTLKEFGVEFES